RLKERVRRTLIHRVDHYLLTRNVSKLFAQSATIQARLQRWGRIPAEVLYPPPPQRAYRCDDYEPYIFALSRLMPHKRMDLLIEAFAVAGYLDLRCVIAGDGPERARLQTLIVARGLQDRIALLGWIGDGDLLNHLARCRAVFFGPLEEDYGLVTLEAFRSAKPVITCTDSGGPTEILTNNLTGFLCAPTPASVADCLKRLASDPDLGPRMGRAAYNEALKFSWEEAVKKLVLV
ncbi:MAG: glycosyltransferase, partial [Acidimicrobiia bacterium]